jgi:hypothetical protein
MLLYLCLLHGNDRHLASLQLCKVGYGRSSETIFF